jgi:phosphoglycolate phosphatase
VSKPDPRHLTQVIALTGGVASRAIMVGDSDVDISTAKRAQVPSILVSFGYAPEGVGKLAPDAVIDHFDQLVPKIVGLLGAAPDAQSLR